MLSVKSTRTNGQRQQVQRGVQSLWWRVWVLQVVTQGVFFSQEMPLPLIGDKFQSID